MFVKDLLFKKVVNRDSSDYNREDLSLAGHYDSNSATNQTFLQKLKNKFTELFEVEVSYTKFGLLFITGLVIIFLSMLYLPMILLFPKKFASLFSLGTFILLFSFIFYYGTAKFFEKIFEKKRCIFTIAYIVGLLGSILLPILLTKNYFIVLFFFRVTTIIFGSIYVNFSPRGLRFNINSSKFYNSSF